MCDWLISTGKVPDIARCCTNEACEILMTLNEHGPESWIAVCAVHAATARHNPFTCSRKQFKKLMAMEKTNAQES